MLGIDNCKGKSPKQEASGVVLADRPTFGCFPNYFSGSAEFFYEIQGHFLAALLIPGNRTLDICDRSLMIFDAISGHSP